MGASNKLYRRLHGVLGVLLSVLLSIPGALIPQPVQAAVTAQDLPILLKLLAADDAVGDNFGMSVAVDGNTAVAGAPNDDGVGTDAGSVYVFVRSGGAWTQQAKLIAADAAADDHFGASVAIDGDTALVGAYGDDDAGDYSGSVYVFVRSGGVWTQQAKLTAADAAAYDSFGQSVAIADDTAVAGALFDSDAGSSSGSAYVFVRSGGVWTQQAKLTAADAAADDYFGQSVAVDGDTAAVGAYGNDDAGSSSGSAYVFVRSGGIWTQQAKLTAADAATDDHFGQSVDISVDTVVAGASYDGDGGAYSGSAYVFVRSGGVWTQQAKLTAADAAADDRFGQSVAIDGDTVVAGAPNDSMPDVPSGSAYAFVRSGGVWTQQTKLTAADAAAYDSFGASVAIDGDTTVAGAPYDDEVGIDAGSAYPCLRSGGVWQCAVPAAQIRLWLDLNGDGIADAGENDYVGPVDALGYVTGSNRLFDVQPDAGGLLRRGSAQLTSFDLAFRAPFAATWSTGAAGTGLQTVDAASGATYDFGLTPLYDATHIAGVVYDDYDADGVFDFANWSDDRYFPEAGVAGVTVTAYDGTGAAVATDVTDAAGIYQLPVGAGQYRLEFTTLPAGYASSAHGTDNATTVVFAAAATNVNLGVYDPADYRGEVRLVTGRTDAAAIDELLRFDYLADYRDVTPPGDPVPRTVVAEDVAVGNTYGLAWQPGSDTLFAGAFFGGRGTAYGPGGGGGIYALDDAYGRTTAGGALFTDLDAYGIATGPDTVSNPCVIAGAGNTAATGCFHDVGSRGLGDLELSADGNTLYAVSPFNDQLVSLAVGSPPTAPGSAATTAIPRPANCPTAADFVPFALGVAPDTGMVYVGATCNARSTQNVANLRGYVYAWNPAGPFPNAPAVDFALDYPRITWVAPDVWQPWAPTSAVTVALRSPLLADIGFDRGDLVLTIADAFGFATADGIGITAAGDILRVCAVGGSWALESAGACGTAAAIPWAAANGDGPGGGEYYWRDEGAEDDSISAGVATLPNYRHAAFTGVDLHSSGSVHGVGYIDQRTGRVSRVVSHLLAGAYPPGKAALLGDLEPLWQPPALEIGNRVWGDLNEDGIQGPGEAGLGGVTVTLWADTTGNGTADTQVGTAVTDAAGNYYFVGGTTADGNPGDAAGVVFYNGGGIQASTAYEIRTDLTQGGIGGLPLTVANAAQPANGNAADSSNDPVTDVADSDAVTSGATGVIAFTTGAAGVNNFGLDLGIAGGTAAIGDYVWNDLDQDGIQDAGEPGIADVTVNLYDGTGAFIMSDVTDVTGIYGFSVAPGTYTVEIEAAEFFAGGELYGFVPSPTGPGESVGVAPFYQYTLTVADGEVRLDVDYGFYADGKLLVGDYVWRDPNRNGTHVGDSGETEYTAGFDGVLINVYRDRDGSGTVTPGDTLWTVTTTGDDPDTLGTQTGWYNVGVLSGEPFLIEIAASNFNPGGVLEGAVSTTGGEVQYVNVTSQNLDFDFGYAYSMSLGSYILHDLDSDGIQDAGEPGIDGATVTLLFESGGFGPAIDLDGNLVLDVVTGADGLYYFDNLPEGTYKIRVTPPAGYLPSPTQNTTPDDDTENDSNLVSESSPGTWDSIALVLAGNAEPIESGAYAGDNQDNTVDANGNMTLDAGFVLMPSLAIEKMLNTPDPVRVGDAISFTIRITNTGPTTIVVLPLEDTYETDYLAYVDAIPTPDNNDNDGTINWSNLTAAVPNGFGSDLGPGAHVDVVVNFIGRRDTSLLPGQEIVNTAMVDSAEDEFGAMPDPVNDDEPVSIFSPTGVLFADRGASREGALVSLRWSTLDETQIAAFHVVRTNSDGTEVVLTADAIPAQFAGQATGTSYSFTDADLAGQSTVHYDLEVVAPDGTVTRLDMGRVHVGATTYLPLVTR